MTYLIRWTTRDAAASISKFKRVNHGLPDSVKVLSSDHAIGEGWGVIRVECSDPKLLHTASAEWAHSLDVEMHPMLTDAEAKQALEKITA